MTNARWCFTDRRHALFRAASACIAGLVLSPLTAPAQDVRIARGGCAQPIHLVAKDVRLSTVLKNLSDRLHFVLVYESQTDPLVSTDARSYATDIVRRVAGDMNFSLEEATDSRCATGRRIAKLSILADSGSGNRGMPAPVSPAQQTPEMEGIARRGMQNYLGSHGIPDQRVEALVAH